jgi:hypothetical protein
MPDLQALDLEENPEGVSLVNKRAERDRTNLHQEASIN